MSDPRILRPCRFCGERRHLSLDEGAFERVPVIDGVVREITWRGSEAFGAEYVDAVHCQVCDTIAALDTWNGTRPASDYAALRDFDDEPAPEVRAA